MSHELNDYIAKQKLHNISDDQIKKKLISSGWDADEIDVAFKSLLSPDNVPPSPADYKFHLPKVFYLLGLVIILISVLWIATSAWTGLNPIFTILLTVIPTIALIVLADYANKQERFRIVSNLLMIAGVVMIPVSLTNLIIQTNIYTHVDATLVVMVFFLTMPFVIYLDSLSRTFVTAVSIFGYGYILLSALALLIFPNIVVTLIAAIGLALAIILTTIAIGNKKLIDTHYYNPLVIFGAVLLVFSVTLMSEKLLWDYSEALTAVLAVVVFYAFLPIYNKLLKPVTPAGLISQRIIMFAIIFTPIVMLSYFSVVDGLNTIAVGYILSIVALIVGFCFKVRLLMYGSVVSFAAVLISNFTNLNVSTLHLVLVILLGLAIIALGYIFSKRKDFKLSTYFDRCQNLGVIGDRQADKVLASKKYLRFLMLILVAAVFAAQINLNQFVHSLYFYKYYADLDATQQVSVPFGNYVEPPPAPVKELPIYDPRAAVEKMLDSIKIEIVDEFIIPRPNVDQTDISYHQYDKTLAFQVNFDVSLAGTYFPVCAVNDLENRTIFPTIVRDSWLKELPTSEITLPAMSLDYLDRGIEFAQGKTTLYYTFVILNPFSGVGIMDKSKEIGEIARDYQKFDFNGQVVIDCTINRAIIDGQDFSGIYTTTPTEIVNYDFSRATIEIVSGRITVPIMSFGINPDDIFYTVSDVYKSRTYSDSQFFR